MKKKILFVINTLGRAGAETALVTLLKYMDPERADIYLYVLLGQGELIDNIPDNVTVLNKKGVDDSSVLSKEGNALLKKRLTGMLSKRCGAAVFKNIPYMVSNMIYYSDNQMKLSAEKLAWRLAADAAANKEYTDIKKMHFDTAVAFIEGGSAYFVDRHVHADRKIGFIHIDYKQAGYSRKLDNNCYDRFDKIYAVSDETKFLFTHVYPECRDKLDIFYNLLDVDLIKTRSKETIPDFEMDKASDGAVKLLTVCRLTSQKAIHVSIEAARKLIDDGVDIEWYVVGEGEERPVLEGIIERLGVAGRFHLLGAKSNPYPYFAAADIYVHATGYEGKSIAIQEAQILGLPVVASDCNGNRQQVTYGVDGYLCPLTPEGIAKHVEMMIKYKHKWEEYADHAKKRVGNDYSKIEELYA